MAPGQLRDLFPDAPSVGQTASTLPMNAPALRRYQRDVDAMFAAGAEPTITLDEPHWLSSSVHDGTYPPSSPAVF